MVNGSIKYLLSLIAAPLAAWFTLHALWGVWGVWWPVYSTLEFVYNTSIACFRYEPLFMVPWAYAAAQEIAQYPVYKSWYGLLTLLGSIGGFGGVLLGLEQLFPADPISKAAQNGVCRLPFKAFRKRFQKLIKISSKNKQWKPGIKIHPELQLSLKEETQHFLILGSTGAGKTNGLINTILLQAAQRGDRVILFDVKGDFTRALRGIKGVMIFAPWDENSVKWDLLSEIRQANECDALAESFIPISKDVHAEEFNSLARQVLSATLKCLYFDEALTWANLKDCLYRPELLIGAEDEDGNHIDGLLERFEVGLPAIATLRPNQNGSDGQTKAVMSMIHKYVGRWIYDVVKAWPGQCNFSISNWIQKGQGVLILQYSNHFKELSKAIVSAACSIAIDKALKLPGGDARLWFIMDEMANFPKISNIKQGLTLARDRGARFVMCSQDVPQLYEVYGKEQTETLINQASTSVFMYQNGSGSSKFISETLGEGEILVTRRQTGSSGKSATIGQSNFNQSTSHDLKIDRLVKQNEIMGLRHAQHIKGGGVEAFLKSGPTGAVTKAVWPLTFLKPPKNAPSNEEHFAPWVWEKDQPIK